jgi:hypothetical protein
MARRAVIARRRRFEEIPVTGNLGSIPSSERGFAGLRLQNKQSIFFAGEPHISIPCCWLSRRTALGCLNAEAFWSG